MPDKKILVQVILLVLAASLFSNFTGMFGKGETGGISFYMVYLFLLTILMKSFGQMSRIISSGLEDFVFFMKALMPSYFLAVTAAGGVASAMIFYNMVLAVIYVIQVILLKLVVPGIHLFVLFQLVNYLHKEDILSKMAEFFKTILELDSAYLCGSSCGDAGYSEHDISGCGLFKTRCHRKNSHRHSGSRERH